VLKIKDIIALGALAIVSFPMVLLGVLLWTGNVRLVFGPESQDPNARGRLLERPEDIPGATKAPEPGKVAAGQTDSALMVRTADLDRREAEALQESQRVQDRFGEAVRLAEQAFTTELAKLVSHLSERLSGQADGKVKIFRDSAVENLTEFFQRFRQLNVRSNEQLDCPAEYTAQKCPFFSFLLRSVTFLTTPNHLH